MNMTTSETAGTNISEPPRKPSAQIVDGFVPSAVPQDPDLYRAGTLQYTRMGLVMLFVWLMWGDFCFTLMESVIPNVLNLKLQSLNAPNWIIGIIITTIPSAMNFMVNPVVSFRSDRYRSKWGRRIPFLLFATPFVTLFLILLGFSPELGGGLHRLLARYTASLSPQMTTVILIGVLIVCFQFFNMFISSVYYYLFNDVVPAAFLARCMALFRVFGCAAGTIFYTFIYRYAQTHMREIFVGAGILYFVGFVLMCWKVKEGRYPPPPPNVGNRKGVLAAAKTYMVECFTHRFYWQFFLMNASWQLQTCIGAFTVFLSLSLGLDIKQLGYMAGTASAISVVLLYPAGMLSDRYHPLRVMYAAMVLTVAITAVGFVYLFYDFTPRGILTLSWVITCVNLPISIMYNAAAAPMYMKILPKERYGQFGSADAMVRSIHMIVGGFAAGLFMDLVKRLSGGNDYYYRFIPFWTIVFQLIAVWFMSYVYRGWKQYGGADYVPPDTGVERKLS